VKELFWVTAGGHALVCFVCQGDTYERRQMTLLTSMVANSGFNKRGEVAICATCGYVHTFMAGSPLDWRPAQEVTP
jgi:hypothetical protein